MTAADPVAGRSSPADRTTDRARTASSQGGPVLDRAAEALAWWSACGRGDTSSVLGTGAIAELEARAAPILGQRLGLALPSGTMALRVALGALGVGPGDDVLVAAADWTAAQAATESLGARAVTVAVLAPTAHIDPEDAKRRCTRRTRAIVVTHLFGLPADTAAVRESLPRDVAIVEDCAQALGAGPADRPVGSLGDLAVCSFGPGKIIDAGEGGLVATSDPRLLDEAVTLSQHPAGQVARGTDRVRTVNLAARMHPVAAVMACHGLDGLAGRLGERRAERDRLLELLRRLPNVKFDEAQITWSSGSGVPVLASGPLGAVTGSLDRVRLQPLSDILGAGGTADWRAGLFDDLNRSYLATLRTGDCRHDR